jgi:hypothetical protein
MMGTLKAFAVTALLTIGSSGAANSMGAQKEGAPSHGANQVSDILLAQRRTCQTVSTCREAVEMWCAGYRRADGDKDGIPCETVCQSKSQVDKIRQEIGC